MILPRCTGEEVSWRAAVDDIRNANLPAVDPGLTQEAVERRAKPAEWEMFTTGHGFVPDPALIDVCSPTYPGWWETPTKNQLLQDFNRASDTQARQQIWQKLQELVFTEAGWAKVGDYHGLRLRSKGVEGFQPVAIGMIVWNVSVPR